MRVKVVLLIGVVVAAGPTRARLAYSRLRRRFNPRATVAPVHIGGRIIRGRAGGKRDLALAVNGRVEAVGRSFYLQGNRAESFSMLIPERALNPGRNDVRLYQSSGPTVPSDCVCSGQLDLLRPRPNEMGHGGRMSKLPFGRTATR